MSGTANWAALLLLGPGYALNDQEITLGVRSIAVPMRNMVRQLRQ